MTTPDAITRRLTGDRGQPLVPLSWYARADAALDDPATRVTAIWAARQNGKSQYLAKRAIGALLATPNASILFLSAGREQSETIFARKFRGPILRLLKAAGLPATAIKMTQSTAENAALNSVLEIVSPTEDTSVSRAVTLLIVDEGRWVSDKTFGAVASSVIGANGKILVASTPGEPSGWFHDLCTHGDGAVAVVRVEGANENPHASVEAIGFLSRLLHRILPAVARRDLGNEFAGNEDTLITPAQYAACECPGHHPLAPHDPDVPPLVVAADLGLTSDCAAVLALFTDPQTGQLVLARHRIFRPVRGETLDISGTVEAELRALHAGFRVAAFGLDPWQSMDLIQRLSREGFPIAPFQQTPSALVKMAIALIEAFRYQRLVLYPNATDLQEHCLNVVAMETSYGARLSKERSSRKIDGAVALAMALVLAAERRVLQPVALW